MNKPSSLRQHLLDSIPHLKRNPESLLVFIESGKLSTMLQKNLNYNYLYNLKLIVTDFAEHPDTLITPLLQWIRQHQIDLKPDDISFEADIISHDSIDLEIGFPLNECVLVTQDSNGKFSTEHLPEPKPEPKPEYNLEIDDRFQELFTDKTNNE